MAWRPRVYAVQRRMRRWDGKERNWDEVNEDEEVENFFDVKLKQWGDQKGRWGLFLPPSKKIRSSSSRRGSIFSKDLFFSLHGILHTTTKTGVSSFLPLFLVTPSRFMSSSSRTDEQWPTALSLCSRSVLHSSPATNAFSELEQHHKKAKGNRKWCWNNNPRIIRLMLAFTVSSSEPTMFYAFSSRIRKIICTYFMPSTFTHVIYGGLRLIFMLK